jgi:hypothetical protein
MQTAIIIMTILGCDDTATQCHFVEMLDQRWATIQDCDAETEQRLSDYNTINYPVVVAVCQTPGDSGLAEAASETGSRLAGGSGQAAAGTDGHSGPPTGGENRDLDTSLLPPADIPAASIDTSPEPGVPVAAAAGETPGFARRMLETITDALPTSENLKTLIEKPVHVVTDQYSWMARRFEK